MFADISKGGIRESLLAGECFLLPSRFHLRFLFLFFGLCCLRRKKAKLREKAKLRISQLHFLAVYYKMCMYFFSVITFYFSSRSINVGWFLFFF